MRSLFFAIASAAARFDRLRFGLAAILAFTGAKMLLGDVVEVPTPVSLAVIAAALLIAAAVSHRSRQAETYARRT